MRTSIRSGSVVSWCSVSNVKASLLSSSSVSIACAKAGCHEVRAMGRDFNKNWAWLQGDTNWHEHCMSPRNFMYYQQCNSASAGYNVLTAFPNDRNSADCAGRADWTNKHFFRRGEENTASTFTSNFGKISKASPQKSVQFPIITFLVFIFNSHKKGLYES